MTYLNQRNEEKIFGKPEKEKKVYRLKRTPLKKKKYAIRRTPIKKKFYRVPKVSAKRKEENKVYSERRKVFLAAHPVCQAGLAECTKTATDIHHKAGRVGKRFLDEAGWLPTCRNCHRKIEADPVGAKAAELSKSRLGGK